MKIVFNLNETVKIKTTETGLALIAKERARLQKEWPKHDWSTWRKPDKEGWLKMQFYDVCNLFGPAMYCGGTFPIEGEIEFLG